MYRFPAISHHSRKSPLRSISAKRGGRFGPAQILALSPAAWYRLGVGITVVTGVSQWNDQSGNGRNLLQATTTAQPALQSDGSILFDGTQHALAATFTLAQPCTYYLLLRQVTWTLNDLIFDGVPAAVQLRQSSATPTLQLNDGTAAVADNTGLVVNTYGTVCCTFNGASSSIKVNGNAATTGNPGASNPGGLTLGSSRAASAFANIQVKEVIIFPVAHDPTTVGKVLKYLGRLGGVSV